MNRTTKPERDAIYAYAARIVQLDAAGRVLNPDRLRDLLSAKFGISRDRCRTAIAHAARRARAGDR